MKLEEINEWLKNAKYITSSFFEYDISGNREDKRIYMHKGQFYSVDFFNDKPCEKWGEKGSIRKGYIRGEYANPIPVKKLTKLVEVTEYVPLTKENKEDEEMDKLVGVNIKKPIIRVKHAELKRIGESYYRSTCPVCDVGILFVRRDE